MRREGTGNRETRESEDLPKNRLCTGAMVKPRADLFIGPGLFFVVRNEDELNFLNILVIKKGSTV